MILDVEPHCDRWKDCDRKWMNGDGGYWCNEECKIKVPRKTVEKVLTTSDAVYVLYANGMWVKREKI